MSHNIELPVREGEHPDIGQEPPQLQFSDLGSEDVRLALKAWAFSTFPNVTEQDTAISVPTSRAFQRLQYQYRNFSEPRSLDFRTYYFQSSQAGSY